jgi:phenylalanyl-tRNA synthetase beta chain
MRVLHRWLQQYTPFQFEPEDLAEKLGMLGLEIEDFQRLGKEFDGFVVGRVLRVQQHPNADQLTVCTVDTGKGLAKIVCGAPNIAAGQLVAVGLPGATVPRSQHDPAGKPVILSRASIRGVDSDGMICSGYELGLSDDASGIMVLESESPPGTPLSAYLGFDDVAYDLEVTPNRPDWLGHIGVAREIAVLTGKKIRLPSVRLKEVGVPANKQIKVRVEDTRNCARFAVRIIRGLTVRQSPLWIQQALRGVGLRPVNNVVDVTNYVMMETGQPLHAFDASLVEGEMLVVKARGRPGPFVTLDGKTHILPGDAVMVCDANREISVAGVIGGQNSLISASTTDVVLEAAYWNPSSIRRTSRALGVSTDASFRFERGVDPGGVLYALDRATALMNSVAGGQIQRGIVDVCPKPFRQRVVPLRLSRANAVLGTSVRRGTAIRILRQLGMTVARGSGDTIRSRVPTFRVDLTAEIDLTEEIARVYGYDKIPEQSVTAIPMSHRSLPPDMHELIRQALIGSGFQEVITMPLQDGRAAGLPGLEPVRIPNARSKDLDTLRTSLIPGLLSVVEENQRNGNNDLHLFELGHVFSRDSSKAPKLVEDLLEKDRLGIVCCGLAAPRHWSSPPRVIDVYDMKGYVSGFLRKLGLDKCRFIYYSTSNSLVDEAIDVEINGTRVGYLGKIRAAIVDLYGIDVPIFASEIELDALPLKESKQYRPFSRYPRVLRDVAFIVESNLPSEKIHNLLLESSTGLLTRVELFDVYEGDRLPSGKKSLAFSLQLTPEDRTLSDEEIDRVIRLLVKAVEERFGATLRSS